MLMTRLMSLKKSSISQLLPPKRASGRPQFLGLGFLAPMSSGTWPRAKCQTRMWSESHCMA